MPHPAKWPVALGHELAEISGQDIAPQEEVSKECILEGMLPHRSPWLQSHTSMPSTPFANALVWGCNRSHDPACGAWCVK